jgi:hypothetical protein
MLGFNRPIFLLAKEDQQLHCSLSFNLVHLGLRNWIKASLVNHLPHFLRRCLCLFFKPFDAALKDIGEMWGRLRAMFDAADVPESEKYWLVREGIHHLTFLDGLIVATINRVKMTKSGHMYGEDPKPAMPMRVWGEGGVMKVTRKVKSKLTIRGKMGMFVGYVEAEIQIRIACTCLVSAVFMKQGMCSGAKECISLWQNKFNPCSGFSGIDDQ